jgi:cobalt-zinc-cadmium efflux system membrane fusion protein
VLTGENQFARRDVVLGEMQNNQMQIVKGIAPGEKLVGNGSLFLQFANSFQH